MKFRWSEIPVPAAAVIAAALAVLVYSASLTGTFHYDDLATIVDNPAVRDPGLAGGYFTDPSLFSGLPGNRMYRPVLLLTYLANHGIAGYAPFVWHLTNVLLHGLNTLLVVLLAAALTRRFAPDRPSPWFPLLAGLAFGLHPVHSEVVNYVSARSGAIATAGFLSALLLHLRATRGGTGPTARVLLGAGAVALLLAGLGGKEIAVALVPVVFLLEALDPAAGPLRRRLARAVVRSAPFAVAAVAYLGIRHIVMDSAMEGLAGRLVSQSAGGDPYTGAGRTPGQNLLTQARVFWLYAGLFAVPVNLAVDRFVRVSTALTEPAVLASVAGIALVVGLLASQWRRRPLLALAGGILFFGLAPTSSILPLNVVMNEHRLYLPGVGVALLLGAGAARFVSFRPRLAAATVVTVAVCWSGLAVARSLEWRDPLTLWTASVRVSPDSYRGHNQLGAIHFEQAAAIGSAPAALPLLDAAIAEYDEAVRLYPDWYDPHLNLGMAWRERARITGSDTEFARSIREFERCTELVREPWRARYQLASTYGVWGKRDEAIRRFAEMAEEDRQAGTGLRLPLYLFPMAKLERERGRLEAGEALYREILVAAPDDLAAHLGLAQSLAEQSRVEEGIAWFKALARGRPGDADVRLAFAEFLLTLDPPDRRGAAGLYRSALALGHTPTPVEMQRYLAR